MQEESKSNLLNKTPEKLFVKNKEKIIPINPNNINVIKSEGNYVELYLDEQSYMIRDSLKNIKEKLDPNAFIRIHRSHIVNINKIKYLEAASGGDYNVRLVNGEEVRLSRRYKDVIEDYLMK
ncbi:LytTR family DNA-binding domain-containing protein [Fodinibius sp. Rm-B-1B1-1]|uniref:LytR/AlgR family response regulator transcription factor n=1 Tax=Fodinibius alkaliphilus TaxID=3140241 RepID=UPI00315995CD